MNLVTGGTGLLGSHIVEQLCKRDMPVRALVRPTSDTSWLEKQPNVELVTGDVTDAESIHKACQGVDVVYHAAARVGDWGPWEEFINITVNGTRNIVDAIEKAKVRRLVHMSSISVYGYVDGEGKVFDETAPLGHHVHRWSYYTRTKVMAEQDIWAAHQKGRIQATVIRPSWLYGPRDRTTMGRMIDRLRRGQVKLIGDGNNRLNVIYAGNVAEASILAAHNDKAAGEAYNCSNDGELTQRQYFNMVAKAAGANEVTKTIPYSVAKNVAFLLECIWRLRQKANPPMITRYVVWLIGRRSFFETKKACQQLGWTPSMSYEKGIPLSVDWYLKNQSGNGHA